MQQHFDNSENSVDSLRSILWLKIIWNNKKILFRSIIVAILIGIAQIFLSPPEYIAWTTIVPQTSNPSQKLGGISSLAAIAGFNLDLTGGDELSPAIYPQILGSALFQRDLMYKKFEIDGFEKPINLYNYFTERQYKSLTQKVVSSIKSILSKLIGNSDEKVTESNSRNTPVLLTKKEDMVCEQLLKRITLNVDIKNGYITLYSAFTNAELAAEVAEFSRGLLQKYITEFKIEKASNQLKFIKERYNEKKENYLQSQQKLARYRDRNKNISSAIAATEEELLRGEYTISLSVYNELSKQLEQAEIRVKEDTPVFSIIQPTKIPFEKSKPKKGFLLIVWFFLGNITAVCIIFGKIFIEKFRQSLPVR